MGQIIMPKVVLYAEEIYGVYNWEVIDLFKEFGDCWVSIGKRNAYCYVTFYNAEEAYQCQQELDGYAFGEGIINVKVHWEQPKKICRYFQKNGHCKFGDKCQHRHVSKCTKCNKKLKFDGSTY